MLEHVGLLQPMVFLYFSFYESVFIDCNCFPCVFFLKRKIIFVLQLPGKPLAKEIKSDSIKLFWEKPQKEIDSYQVRFKLRNGDSKWKFADVSIEENFATIQGLMANSEYVFQVRTLHEEQEGPYGPISDAIKTHESSATTFLGFCVQQNSSTPPKYLLPIVENKSARNKTARTRQLVLGNSNILCNAFQ